jgi:hypothetical protein
MWIMAASVSTQFHHIREPLYIQTKSMLENLELTASAEPTTIEELQARTLLAMYETMNLDLRKGWISAGHSIRLALLLRLHEIDVPGRSTSGVDANPQAASTWVETEERRRTFWAAFAFDCFMNLINEAPYTTNEETVTGPSDESLAIANLIG